MCLRLLIILISFCFGFAFSQTPLFQNTNENIWTGNSAACTTTGPGTIHNNSFIRVFDTDDFGIQDTAFFVNIEFAVQQCTGGSYNLIGKVYSLNGTLAIANMSLISDDTVATYADSSLYRIKIPFDEGYALPGDTLVTEVFAPLNPSIIFFPGSNPYLENGPSYIMAAGCGLIEPTTYASIGYTDVKLILKLWVNQKPSLNLINTEVFKDNILMLNKTYFDAGLNDYDNDSLTMIRIESLPSNGVLKLNGLTMNVGDSVLWNEFDLFTYTPNAGYFGFDNFQIKVKDNYHWSNQVSDININVINWQLSIDENSLNIQVFPNPVVDEINLKGVADFEQYKIYTSSGTCVLQGAFNSNTVKIDVANLTNGSYFLQLSNHKESTTYKVIIQ